MLEKRCKPNPEDGNFYLISRKRVRSLCWTRNARETKAGRALASPASAGLLRRVKRVEALVITHIFFILVSVSLLHAQKPL
jgi:hypothetical protein